MSPEDQQKCIDLTTEFYASVASSFSATREAPWDGWREALSNCNLQKNLTVLDLACGNLRFEKFLIDEGYEIERAICLDNCPTLIDDLPEFLDYREVDFFKKGTGLFQKVDLTVCFGFMHHVPSFEKRLETLEFLVDSTNSNGYTIVSFWQFLNEGRLVLKSKKATSQVCKQHSIKFDDENDRFLHWQDDHSVARYCHNFSDDEISKLVDAVSDKTRTVNIFSEDGKLNNLNRYAVLQKNYSF